MNVNKAFQTFLDKFLAERRKKGAEYPVAILIFQQQCWEKIIWYIKMF